MTHDGAYMIVIPMSRWHKAANDDPAEGRCAQYEPRL